MKIVRRLRIIEYVGPEDAINKQIDSSALRGRKRLENGITMTSVWLGDTNEIISTGHTKKNGKVSHGLR